MARHISIRIPKSSVVPRAGYQFKWERYRDAVIREVRNWAGSDRGDIDVEFTDEDRSSATLRGGEPYWGHYTKYDKYDAQDLLKYLAEVISPAEDRFWTKNV